MVFNTSPLSFLDAHKRLAGEQMEVPRQQGEITEDRNASGPWGPSSCSYRFVPRAPAATAGAPGHRLVLGVSTGTDSMVLTSAQACRDCCKAHKKYIQRWVASQTILITSFNVTKSSGWNTEVCLRSEGSLPLGVAVNAFLFMNYLISFSFCVTSWKHMYFSMELACKVF